MKNSLKQAQVLNHIYTTPCSISIDSVEVAKNMISKITALELQFLDDALNSDYKKVSVRLREGEYQYELSRVIAVFQLQFYFPDVKDLVKKLHGEEKINDVQLIRKIQTILKKMEKSGVVRILPKTKPWELQRYAISSFKFLDSDKNQVLLATDEQIRQTKEKIKTMLTNQQIEKNRINISRIKIYISAFLVVLSYSVIVWDLSQMIFDPIIFALSFSLATISAIMLGEALSKHDKGSISSNV